MSTSTGANAGTDAGVQWTKIPSLASRHQAGTRCRRSAWSRGSRRAIVRRTFGQVGPGPKVIGGASGFSTPRSFTT